MKLTYLFNYSFSLCLGFGRNNDFSQKNQQTFRKEFLFTFKMLLDFTNT